MRLRWIAGSLLVLLLGLAGCRGRVPTAEGPPEDTTTHLAEQIDLSLADWLRLPRAEQAKLVEEWTVTVAKQREEGRTNLESVQLLPQLHPPAAPVVFAEAHFAPAAGFSLPPYLPDGRKDAAVALHLARFGDREAALKLAGDDKIAREKIDAARTARDYPLEWARLAGLVLENAELKVAKGDVDGASELVLLHKQLREILDTKAASGPLGAALLGRGREALKLAADAWRQPRWNKSALAADIDAALAGWGEVPEPAPALTVGAGKADVAALFGTEAAGPVVVAGTVPAVHRALDLLALPLPSEGASGAAAFLDDKDKLAELVVLYRPKINELFPEPRHLALPLIEHDYKAEKPAPAAGVNRQTWTGGGLGYEVSVLTRGNVGGAVVRVGKAGAAALPAAFARNPRDFGAVHLDRSFEQNRLGLLPDQNGPTLEVTDKERLQKVTQPAGDAALSAAVLQREANADLLARLTLRWPADDNANALYRLALPLWAAYGPARLESAEEQDGGLYTLTWEDGTTRVKLRLPFDQKAPELTAEDRRPAALQARAEAAEEFDRRERQQRLASGHPRTRLARFVQLPAYGIEALKLGMTREQVQTALPGTRSLRVLPLSDGLNVLLLNEPPASVTHWPRQLFVRFGADGTLAEVRVRYQIGPRAPGKGAPGLLDLLKARPNGAPETLPAPWAGLWTDLPTRVQPVLYRWLDDATCLTCQLDRGNAEVTLRDCPPDRPHGVELPPLVFCGHGVDGCNLGDARADVHKRWRVKTPLLASNGAEVQPMPAGSPYDVLLIWYENDKVSKVIARHRKPARLLFEDVANAMQQAWAADFDRLGFLRRQDGVLGPVLQSYSFHDDRTRVRIFAQDTEEGIRLFTEWQGWPIPAKTLAAK